MATNNDLGSLSYSLNIDISQLPDTIRAVEKQLSGISTVADISTRVDPSRLIGAIKQALMAEDFKLKVTLDDSFKSAIENASAILNKTNTPSSGNIGGGQLGYIDSLIQKLKELENQYKNLPKGADASALLKEFASVQAELDKSGKNLSSSFNKSWADISKMSENTIGDIKSKIRSLEQYKLTIPLSNPTEITKINDLINKLKVDISSLSQTQQSNPFQLPENSIKEIEAKIKALRELRDFSPIRSQDFIDADKALGQIRDKMSYIGKLNLSQSLALPEKSIEDLKNKLKALESLKIRVPIDSYRFQEASKEIERLKKLISDINSPTKPNRSLSEVMGMDTNTLNQITAKLNEIRRLRGEINVNNPNGISHLNSLNKAEADLLRLQQQRLGANQQINETYASQASLVDNLTSKALGYFSLEKMQQFASKLIEIRGEFEKQQVALQVILQSKDQADKLFSQVVDLGLKSPFSIMQLNSYVKGLAAYRIETDQLFDTTKRLADISSGLGVDMGRLILAYGQVRAASVLRGQEVRQFTEAGIPLIEALADQFTRLEGRVVSTNEVFDKISNRLVPFEMVRDVLFEMTDAGGVFFNMQEKQAETLGAKWKNLQDAMDVMYNSIGQDNEGFLKGMAEGLTALTENWRDILGYIESAIAALGTYKALSIATGSSDVLVKSLMATRNVSEEVARRFINMQTGISGGFSRIGLSVRRLSESFRSFLATNGWMILAAAIAGVAMKLYTAYQEAQRFKNELGTVGIEGRKEVEALTKSHDDLIKKIKETTDGTIARKEAIDQLNKQFGSYYTTMLTEANALQVIAGEYDNVNAKIRENSRLKGAEKIKDRVDQEYDERINKGYAEFKNSATKDQNSKYYSKITSEAFDAIIQTAKQQVQASNDFSDKSIVNAINQATKSYGLTKDQVSQFNRAIYGNGALFDNITDIFKLEKQKSEELNKALAGLDTQYGDVMPGATQSKINDFNKQMDLIDKRVESTKKEANNLPVGKENSKERIINEAEKKALQEKIALAEKFNWVSKKNDFDLQLKRISVSTNQIQKASEKAFGLDSKSFTSMKQMTSLEAMQGEYKRLSGALKTPKLYGTDIDKDGLNDFEKDKKKLDDLKKLAKQLDIDLDPKGSKKAASQAEDARLARYKAEIVLVKQAYGDYKKYLEVLDEVSSKSKIDENYGDQFKSLGIDIKYASDELSFYQSLEAKLSKGTSKKDKALWNGVNKEIGGSQAEIDLEALKKDWKNLNDLFDLKKEAYALRDMYMQKGISKQVAESFVKQIYGDIPLEFDSFQEDVSAKLSEASGNWGSDSGKAFKKSFGQEAKNSFLDMLDKFQTTQQKIDGINFKYSQIFKELELQKVVVSAEAYQGMVANAEKAKSEELSAVTAIAIQMTDAYQRMFSSITEMSEKELNYLIQKWKTALDTVSRNLDGTFTIKIDGKDFKTTEQQIASFSKKVLSSEKELRSKNPFKAVGDSLKELKKNSKKIQDIQDKIDALTKLQGTMESEESVKELGKTIDELKDKLAGLKSQNASTWTKTATSIKQVTADIKDLGGSVSSLLDAFGASDDTKETLNNIMGIVGGMGDIASGIGRLESGDVVGGLSQGISGISSLISSIGSLFGGDGGIKEYEKAVDIYERMEDVLSKVIDKQKELISISTGSQSAQYYKDSIDAIDKQIEYKKKVLDKFMDSGGGMWSHSKGYRENRYIKKWQSQLTENGFDVKSWQDLYKLSADQISELQKTMPEFYASLFDETKDYLQLIVDKQDELTELTAAYKEALTGLSFDTLLNSLDNLLQSSDTTFSQIGDSFDDNMRNAVLNFVKNNYLRKAMTEWYDKFADSYKDDALTANEVDDLRKMYEEIYNKAQNMYDTALDVAGVSKESNNLSGLSKGIQGITEDTAQIIEAYLNTMRDVIISIMMVQENQLSVLQASQLIQSQILTEVATMSSATVSMNNALMSVIAQSNGDNGAGIRVYIK